MNQSILTSVKKMLGMTEDYEPYDPVIIMHINSVLMILGQLGVGPSEGFSISDKTATWSDLVSDSAKLEAVRSYVYLKVKLLFDPPLSSTVMDAMKQMIGELEWRLNAEAESSGKEDANKNE